MGRRGPRPTPTQILKLRGSWLAKGRPDDPDAVAGMPEPPQWLTGDALAMWADLTAELHGLGLLAKFDRNALARYCDAWARWRTAAEFIDKRGTTYPIKDSEGNLRMFQQWPQVNLYHKLSALLLKMEQEFGLTPAARTRLPIQNSSDQKPKGIQAFKLA